MNDPQIFNSPGDHPADLPNATAALVLGIMSIVCSCIGVGVICAIIGLVLANMDIKLYRSNPGSYSSLSYGSSNAGRICSIVGLVIGGIFLLIITWNIFQGGHVYRRRY